MLIATHSASASCLDRAGPLQFNNTRLLEPIGWTSPAEYEKAYYLSHRTSEKAA